MLAFARWGDAREIYPVKYINWLINTLPRVRPRSALGARSVSPIAIGKERAGHSTTPPQHIYDVQHSLVDEPGQQVLRY